MRIAVLGAGAWGTAVAISLARRRPDSHNISLWSRDTNLAAALLRERQNMRYLPGHALPPTLLVTHEIGTAVDGADLIIVGTTTAGLGDTVTSAYAQRPNTPLLWLCKGFINGSDNTSPKLPHEVVRALCPGILQIGVLSGPSFAQEVAKGLPAALTLAADDVGFAKAAATALGGNSLRVYASNDLVGVELGGALKNVMAIAAGICDGLQLGMNARAALITRGLAEMVRLGVAMGGKPETFMGLTGVGDLILTATGNLSRNRSVGLALASGKPLATILSELGHVAEGVSSARATLTLARMHGVEMPITEAVSAVLFDGAVPATAVQQLLSREVKSESGLE